jgi:molybdopterin converting factor small subunit
MLIQVEFFGIPRARAGVDKATARGDCLGEVLADLARQFPELAEACIEDQQLRPGYTANLRGERFVPDPETQLSEGDTLLLLNLDAGG